MRKLEPKPLTAMKTKRGNFLLAVGATSEIYMRRMLDIDIDYDGIANLNRPFLTTSINKTDEIMELAGISEKVMSIDTCGLYRHHLCSAWHFG
jgi:hypothetical protein